MRHRLDRWNVPMNCVLRDELIALERLRQGRGIGPLARSGRNAWRAEFVPGPSGFLQSVFQEHLRRDNPQRGEIMQQLGPAYFKQIPISGNQEIRRGRQAAFENHVVRTIATEQQLLPRHGHPGFNDEGSDAGEQRP